MVLHDMTPWQIPGLRGPAVGIPYVYVPPWSRTVQLMILLAVSLQKGALQLDAYQTLAIQDRRPLGSWLCPGTFDGSP